MRQPHETATQPVQLVPAAEAITCSEHVVLQHFLRCMVLVLHFLHTHWWEILLHRSTTAAFTSSLIGMCHHSSTQRLTLSPESCCRGELLAWPRVGGGGAGGSGGDRFKSPTGMCWAWPAVSALRASSCLIFSLQVCIRMRAYSNMWVSKALRAT